MFKIPYTGNEPEIIFFLGLYGIVVISRIMAVYQILDCMSRIHNFSMLGDFSPARMVGGGEVSYGDC